MILSFIFPPKPPPLLFLPYPFLRASLDTSGGFFFPSEQVVLTRRQKESGPRLHSTTPFLCWASWCVCVCVCVCVQVCVAPRSMQTALPLNQPLPSQQRLCCHFPDGLLLLGPHEDSCFCVFRPHPLNTLAPFLQSIKGFISHLSFVFSDHCLLIDLQRVLDVELANVLLWRG